jgi:hypothetical protein
VAFQTVALEDWKDLFTEIDFPGRALGGQGEDRHKHGQNSGFHNDDSADWVGRCKWRQLAQICNIMLRIEWVGLHLEIDRCSPIAMGQIVFPILVLSGQGQVHFARGSWPRPNPIVAHIPNR